MNVWSRFRRLPKSARFLAIATVNFGLNLGITALLHEALGLPPAAAFAITLVIVTLFSFVMFRFVVFESTHRRWPVQLAEFVASVAGFRLLEYGGFLLIHTWGGVHYLVTAAAVLTGSFVAKFLWYRLRVFAEPAMRR